MNASVRAHGGLTPGREGKGREQGSGREDVVLTACILVTSVPREAVNG